MQASITIDVEHDCPPFLNTYRGITDGLPRLLAVLADNRVRATFFSTGDVARRYPDAVKRIVDDGHELGCHGDTHARFSTLDEKGARRELQDASESLRKFSDVRSFRAPNLDLPEVHLPLLAEYGYTLDSSWGRHKCGSYFIKPDVRFGIRRIPASISPLPMRAPSPIRRAVLALLEAPIVLFFHPWEFVDMSRTGIRLDCRIRTGEPALDLLEATIADLRRRSATLVPMRELQT